MAADHNLCSSGGDEQETERASWINDASSVCIFVSKHIPSSLTQHVLSENARGHGRGSGGGEAGDDDGYKAESDAAHLNEAAEAIAEYRVRLISGLKRYFHSKHEQVCSGWVRGLSIRLQ